MSEIRNHYFLDKKCIVATERSKRPSDFINEEKPETDSQLCPFCEGNESSTPPGTVYIMNDLIITKFEEDGNQRAEKWNARCFANLYPILPDHEVIVENPNHNKQISDFSDEEINLLMEIYRDRIAIHYKNEAVKYVSIFKNHGEDAGASLSHPHSQVIPLPFVPPDIKEEIDFYEKNGQCPFGKIMKEESCGKRVITENEEWLVISPYFSKVDFEIWILPKKHISNLMQVKDLKMLGVILRDTLEKLNILLKNPSYNLMIYQMAGSFYHMTIRIEPKLNTAAGFEKGTGVYINTINPKEVVRLIGEV